MDWKVVPIQPVGQISAKFVNPHVMFDTDDVVDGRADQLFTNTWTFSRTNRPKVRGDTLSHDASQIPVSGPYVPMGHEKAVARVGLWAPALAAFTAEVTIEYGWSGKKRDRIVTVPVTLGQDTLLPRTIALVALQLFKVRVTGIPNGIPVVQVALWGRLLKACAS